MARTARNPSKRPSRAAVPRLTADDLAIERLVQEGVESMKHHPCLVLEDARVLGTPEGDALLRDFLRQ